MVVLDTGFIIDFLNEREEAINHFQKLLETQEELSTTVINIYELEVGVRKSSKKEKNRKTIDEILKIAKVFDIDLKTTNIAARIFDGLAKKGDLIDDFDIFIAASCIANNDKLLTKNVKDFKRIEELEVETY